MLSITNKFRIAAVAGAAVIAGGAHAHLILDTFDIANDPDINLNLSSRQSGPLATTTYRQGSANNNFIENSTLDLRVLNAATLNYVAVAMDRNFQLNDFSVQFDVDPVVGDGTSSTGGAGIILGLNVGGSTGRALPFAGGTGATVDGSTIGLGILFRSNGSYDLYDRPDTNGTTTGTPATSDFTGTGLPTAGGGFMTVRIDVDSQGPAGSDALISLFAKPVGAPDAAFVQYDLNSDAGSMSFVRTGGFLFQGVLQNYIQLAHVSTTTGTNSQFDNFQVVPEPATIGACLIGFAGLVLRRRRK